MHTGESWCAGPNVMNGYWREPRATASRAGGWLVPLGRHGPLRRRGLSLSRRPQKDMIISGGENIVPAEIENVLRECQDIAEAAVVGRPDERWGEVVVAVVAPQAPVRPSTPSACWRCSTGASRAYKHPKDVLFVGELPNTALGKVRKEDVRRLVATRLAQTQEERFA